VHIDGGMSEFISVPIKYLIKGNDMSFEELALVEPLAIGAHGIRRADVKTGEFVLVIGAGTDWLRCNGICKDRRSSRNCNGC
jgi:Threonine dehydrogenase and related Zn-dependent dehydrogenases